MEWRRDIDIDNEEYIKTREKVHVKSFLVLIFKAIRYLQCHTSYVRICDKQYAHRTTYGLLEMVFSKRKWKHSMLEVDMIEMFKKFDIEKTKKAKQVGYESSLMIIDEDAFAKEG